MICKLCGDDKDENCFGFTYTYYTLKSTGEKMTVHYRRSQCKSCRYKADKGTRLKRFFNEIKSHREYRKSLKEI